MKNKKAFLAACLILPVLSSCNLDMKKIENKAVLINRYENVALKLAKQNRELHAEVKRLEFEVQKIKQELAYYEARKLGKSDTHGEDAHAKPAGRAIASVNATPFDVKKDFVEFKTYKWTAEDMMKIADKEFKTKNFEKAAQFYTSLENNYPHFKHLNDEFYFKAGISSFESGEHHEWTIKHFEALMTKYPTSKYFRSAKLWVALTHMKQGEKAKFFATVEEFRKKYRNTNEWKILSSYYEKIEEKTNE